MRAAAGGRPPALLRPAAIRLLSVAAFFLVWWLAASLADSRLLPGPAAVLSFLARETVSGELPYQLSVTLARVAVSFVLAMTIGSAIGLVMGRSRLADGIAEPWIILLLNTPALVLIVLAYVWLGLSEVAAILAAALNKIPNVAVTVREGARAFDPAYMEMAKVYRFPRGQILRDVMLPQLQPYLAAAGRSGLALIWKIVLVVELLGRSNGVGFQIHLYFQMFDVRAILAYTIAFVAVMLTIEFLLVQPVETRAYRWRPRAV